MKTHWKKLDNPNYLGAYSLMDGEAKDLTVTIEKVLVEDVVSERGTEKCKVIHLKGQKPMILNATNSKTIAKVTESPYIEDWSGKQITLYVAKIKAFGDVVECLRVRPTAPKKQLPDLTPHHPKWDAIQKGLAMNQCTIEDIKRNYLLTPKNQKELCNSK